MKMVMCAIRDRAADTFGRPMFLATKGQAIRSFADEINRKAEDNMMYNHPEDFDLYFLGIYDDQDASFEAVSPQQIAVGKDCKQ